jgi:hypothetical protein
MGRPKRLKGAHQRSITLDDKTGDEADRIPNFSSWVRAQLTARLNGEERVFIDELPTQRLCAIVLNRVQRQAWEAGEDVDEQPEPELVAVADAILEWFRATNRARV